MYVEIKGIGMPNKGAELMLIAVRQAFENAGVDADFVVEPHDHTPYRSRAVYGLYQKCWFEVKGVQVGRYLQWLPTRLLRRFGIVLDSEISVILDASGFAYGDQWGHRKLRNRLSRYVARWRKAGKPVVLLPQALGPFRAATGRQEMQTVLDHVHLVFARDRQSLDFLDGFEPGRADVRHAPDFTNLVTGRLPERFDATALDVCVIPNRKMIDMGEDDDEQGYIESLAGVIRQVQDKGRRAFLLNHEGDGDEALVNSINARLTDPVPVVRLEDPVQIKGVIGASRIVVSSRFHGLVGALSQGVPVVATGWSHKYEELLNDYGVTRFLVDHQDGALAERVDELLNEERRAELVETITSAAAVQKERSQDMWQEVFALLKSCGQVAPSPELEPSAEPAHGV